MKATRVFGWVLGIGIVVGTLWLVGVGALYYVDIPSLIVVAGISIGVGLVAHGTDVFAAYRTAIRGGSAAECRTATATFRLLARALPVAGVFAVLMGVIAMLSWPLDTARFGRGLGTALLGPLYSIVLYLFAVLPFASRVEAGCQ